MIVDKKKGEKNTYFMYRDTHVKLENLLKKKIKLQEIKRFELIMI